MKYYINIKKLIALIETVYIKLLSCSIQVNPMFPSRHCPSPFLIRRQGTSWLPVWASSWTQDRTAVMVFLSRTSMMMCLLLQM